MRIHIICFAFLLLLSACGENKPPNPTQSTPSPAETTPPTTADTSAAEPSKPAAQEADTAAEPPHTDITPPAKEMSGVEDDDANNEGLNLAKNSGCLACHAIDKKVVGPAWKDVAKRYAGDANAKAKLIEKVAKGGRGNWTNIVGNMAMPPYSPRVSAENIEALVDFVLSLHTE